VSISLSFLAYFPFNLFFLATRSLFSGISVFLPSLFVFFRVSAVFSNFCDYSRRWLFLRIFPHPHAADFRAAIIDRFTIRRMLRALFYFYFEKRDFVIYCVFLFIALILLA